MYLHSDVHSSLLQYKCTEMLSHIIKGDNEMMRYTSSFLFYGHWSCYSRTIFLFTIYCTCHPLCTHTYSLTLDALSLSKMLKYGLVILVSLICSGLTCQIVPDVCVHVFFYEVMYVTVACTQKSKHTLCYCHLWLCLSMFCFVFMLI